MEIAIAMNRMKAGSTCFDELSRKNVLADICCAPMAPDGIFTERNSTYLNEFSLFLFYYKRIPNFIHEVNIDCEKANLWFANNYKAKITDWYYDKRYFNGAGKAKFDDVFYMLDKDLLVNFDTNQGVVRLLFRETDMAVVEGIAAGIRKFKKRAGRRRPELSLLVSSRTGITTKDLDIVRPRLNIADNYNDDLADVHATIMKRLNKKNDKGLILLHGKPGTGKTSYIRYLICALKKNVIFLPPNMAEAITSPDLIAVLIDNPNSVFVIEDAEQIIVDRERHGHSPVSALLNICDGLLSDCLNIQVICSFNTDISKVDSALMRKGRLIARYEFKELEVYKARALSAKLGFTASIDTPMTLTAIYNQEEREYGQVKKMGAIGFNAAPTS